MTDQTLGQRLREIRSWRQLSLRTTAELSGLSHGFLGKVERGEKELSNRQTLEAVANTLQVSPAELTGAPYAPSDPVGSAALAGLDDIETAMMEWMPGEVPDDSVARPWEQVTAEFRRLNEVLRPESDYATQGTVLPILIRDLLSHLHGPHRKIAVEWLMSTYYTAGNYSSRLGKQPLAYLAASRVREAAELSGAAEWMGVAAAVRAQFLGSTSRPRQYRLATASAEFEGSRLEARGMSHLTAAMAAAAQGDRVNAEAHLTDAADIATRVEPHKTWGLNAQNFSTANVGIWRVAIATELGDGAKVAEIARDVEWWTISNSRQGAFWMDLGRGLLQDKNRRDEGARALLRAEKLTPQQVRVNPFARQAVAELLRKARRDAGGAELRGLAWRMGLAPTG